MTTLDLIRDAVSWMLFIVGGAGVVVGAIGMIRFPDFYARLHASGIVDTAGAELILFGMILQAPNWLVAAKLAIIGFFLFMTSPVSAHAIAHAAHVVGLRPMLGEDLRREGDPHDG
jgi:multicomponent Na+:H+ antiporter subunit G